MSFPRSDAPFPLRLLLVSYVVAFAVAFVSLSVRSSIGKPAVVVAAVLGAAYGLVLVLDLNGSARYLAQRVRERSGLLGQLGPPIFGDPITLRVFGAVVIVVFPLIAVGFIFGPA